MEEEALTELDTLRTAALLHDIGKPSCWSRGGGWSQHIYDGYEILNEVFPGDLAEIALHHHTGLSYPERYHPNTEGQWIVWLADKLSSGTDRAETPEKGDRSPEPPFQLTHPLSHGDVALVSLSSSQLAQYSSKLRDSLQKTAEGFQGSPREAYKAIYRCLEGSALGEIPADTRPPINDVSLWHHSKLTAAITTCIAIDGGWIDRNPESYRFRLLSGDGDRISRYIGESQRLPDLNARSMKVNTATEEAALKISDELGPECVLFAGGGSLLALTPELYSETLTSEVSEVFEEAMDGEASITVNSIALDGGELQKRFGESWGRGMRGLRMAKLSKPIQFSDPIEPETVLCDICNRREAVYDDPERTRSPHGVPRPERLCRNCWNLREKGRGIWIEDLADESNYIAVLKADGDSIGQLFSGDKLEEYTKSVTPSRLSTLSSLVNDTCEKMLKRIVDDYGGRTVYAGGDDLLAILPAREAFDAALELRYRFMEALNKTCTMSAGMAVMHKKLPVYTGLEQAYKLIQSAKQRPNKNSIAYTVVSGVGAEHGTDAVSWEDLDRILQTVEFFKTSDIANTQIRRIAQTMKREPMKAMTWIKHLMGKNHVSWDQGEELLNALESGLLRDSFVLYNLLKVK